MPDTVVAADPASRPSPHHFWPVPTVWRGRPRCVVIGSGPSLDLADLRRIAMAKLAGACRVIAVNDAVFVAWWADWLHACDGKWWQWHIQRLQHFPGIRTTADETVSPLWAHRLRLAPVNPQTDRLDGFPDAPDTVAGGSNSGNQAIQLAAKAGAGAIGLVGFDCRPHPNDPAKAAHMAGRIPGIADYCNTPKGRADWKAHFFGDHRDGIRSSYRDWLPQFATLVVPLARRGVDIFNLTPGSAIDCFPRATLREFLDD